MAADWYDIQTLDNSALDTIAIKRFYCRAVPLKGEEGIENTIDLDQLSNLGLHCTDLHVVKIWEHTHTLSMYLQILLPDYRTKQPRYKMK